MSDLSPIPSLPPAPDEPAARPGWWWRLVHRRTTREAQLLAAHHAWTTDRARRAQIAIVREGYHLGPIPYGYLQRRVPTQDAGHRRVRLAVNPGRASVVAAIYRWRIEDRLTTRSITTRLHGLAHPALTLRDPNTGDPRPWTPAAVTHILANPVYTGATVWGRTRAGRPVPPDEWVIRLGAHQPIIDGRTFHRAQLLAPPGTGIFTPLLPPWEFTDGPPARPSRSTGSGGPTA